jgi:glycosyltransferase involved in cell wall biosynthesis
VDPASIVIPHYRTPDQLDLCLRCIDHYTDEPHETLVVDNGSGEETLARLRQRAGITLLERAQDPSKLDQDAHKAALDLGIAHAHGRFVVTLHSDTFVLRKGWLRFLISRLEDGDLAAFGPTSHRLYPTPAWRRLLRLDREKAEAAWIRPVFTIYRAEIFEKLHFVDFDDVGTLTAPLVAEGRVGFLSRREAAVWAFHMGGTTRLETLRHRRKAKRRKDRQFRHFLARPEIRRVLETS